jgi:hypothetical protein
MGNMTWWGIFAGVLILLLGKSGWAVENEWKTVSVLTLEDYPPYCSLTSDVKTRFELPPRRDTLNFIYSEEPINHANFVISVRQDNPIVWDGLKSLISQTSGV